MSGGSKNVIRKNYKALKKLLTMLDIKLIIGLPLILFGQYFEIRSSKIRSFFVRCYCICVTVLALNLSVQYITILVEKDVKAAAVNTLITIEYIAGCIISQITGHAYLSIFTDVIHACDSRMGYPTNVFGTKSVLLIFAISSCVSLSSFLADLLFSQFWAMMLADGSHNVLFLLNHQYSMASIDMSSFKVLLALGLLTNRLMLLRKTLEENGEPEIMAGYNVIRSKIQIVEKCLHCYRNLLDAFDNIYGHLEFAVSVPNI